MDYDDVMLYVKRHPDCSSMDLGRAFGVTRAKAFTFMNTMVEAGLAYKTRIRSPSNYKKIIGYRAVPWFDEINDNGDGSMRRAEVVARLRVVRRREGDRVARQYLESTNDWRRRNGVEEIGWVEL